MQDIKRSQPTKATASLLFYHKTAFLQILKYFRMAAGLSLFENARQKKALTTPMRRFPIKPPGHII
jgi:hypothetical protein